MTIIILIFFIFYFSKFYKASPLLFWIFIIISGTLITIKVISDKKQNEKAEIERLAKEEQKRKEEEEQKKREQQRLSALLIQAWEEDEKKDEFEEQKKVEIIKSEKLKNEYNRRYELCDEYIIFDLETTGLNACENEIIEIGAIKYKNGIEISNFHSYIKPTEPIPYKITELTGITDDMVCDAKETKSVLQDFIEYIKDSILVAHNSDFDMSFLQTEIYHCFNYTLNNEVIDTLKLARKFLPNLNNHKLKTIKDYFKINIDSHNALNDCYVTAELYNYCFNRKDDIISPFDANIKFTPFEIQLFEIVKTILKDNNLSIEPIGMHRNTTYTEILYNKLCMLTFKLKGRLTYWLVDMDLKSFSEQYGIEGVKEASKSENSKVRVPLDNIENVIKQLDKYVLTEYNRCQESEKYKQEWNNRGKPTSYSIMIEVEDGKLVKKVYYE